MHLRTRLIKYSIIGVFILNVFHPINTTHAQNLRVERSYEPVVLVGGVLAPFYGIQIDEIFLYAYDGITQTWRLIPFQIDEKTYGIDPYNEPRSRWFYFIPEAWDVDNHDQVLGDHDELVFMVRDLGDKAPDRAWIDNDEAKTHARLELLVADPLAPDNKAYAYLFRSSTIQDAVPEHYGFDYQEEDDHITTTYYDLALNVNGLIKDLAIKEPWGNGQDIFDTQKIRFGGILDLALPIEIIMTEEYLHLFDDIRTTPTPIVRLIRQARQTLKIGTFISDDTPFYLTAKFYPYSANIETGASITTKDLSEMYQYVEISIILNSMRHSWDFNSDANGMIFYNKYNDGILIDGQPDVTVPTIDLPINEWSLVSGTPGSVFWHFALQESNWDTLKLYYHDDLQGGQADDVYHGNLDTGDNISYGDHGILFISDGRDSLNLDLDLTMFLIPEINLQKSDGERLASIIRNPVETASSLKSDVTNETTILSPAGFRLFQNHPNPFNASTRISFTIPGREWIRLQIISVSGRIIRTLIDEMLEAGSHQTHWDGLDDLGQHVASGLYFYELSSSNHARTKKLMLLE